MPEMNDNDDDDENDTDRFRVFREQVEDEGDDESLPADVELPEPTDGEIPDPIDEDGVPEFDPDNQVYTGPCDGDLVMWDVSTGHQQKMVAEGSESFVRNVEDYC